MPLDCTAFRGTTGFYNLIKACIPFQKWSEADTINLEVDKKERKKWWKFGQLLRVERSSSMILCLFI